jgi:oxygen-independent coproporphyrinogen III oxidase
MPSDAEVRRLTGKYEIGNVPGYLSYPAVSKWHQPMTARDVIDVSRATAQAGDSYLYFHFPYCETLCYYCACYMKVTANPKERYDEYIRGIEKELELKLRDCDAITAGDMHWGGGTPTYMDCEQMERVFRLIERRVRWKQGATLSLEAYPDARTLSDEKLELLRALGFTQVSFGIESLDPVVLQAINRRHDIDSIRHWVDKARSLGFGVHVDLVYGLPYQTEESLRSTVQQVMSIQPDRLATFLFMYTPSSVKHQKVIPHESVPDSLARFHLYEVLQEVAGFGYTRVGCDHWVRGEQDPLGIAARTGEIIYHFQGYEPLSRENFLGFGSSAISFAQNRYFQNTRDLKGYLSSVAADAIPLIDNASHTLDTNDQVRHFVIMKSVMSDLAIDKDAVERRFGVVFDDYFAPELTQLEEMEREGLVEGSAGRRVTVTPLGCIFIRNIARVFDGYFAARQPSQSKLRVVS